MKAHLLFGLFALLPALVLAAPTPSATAKTSPGRPNFLLILADDLGYSDIGCYGSEIETPHLDRMAKEGLRFSQFYNAARCCPTRASLLTGLDPHQAGIGNMVIDQGLPAYRGDLNENCLTIAQALKGGGYRSYMTGKWHVTKHTDVFADWIPADKKEYVSKHNWPLQRGFDRFYGTIHGAGSFFDPATLVEGNEAAPPVPSDFYYTDAISERTLAFLREHRAQHADRPFFFYVAYTAPHWPLHARVSDIESQRGRYDRGWDVVRLERLQRMQKMGLVPGHAVMSERDPDVPAWEKESDRATYARAMEIYAAQVASMDRGIGRIVEELKTMGAFDNTVVLFLSDNGGCAEVIHERWPRSLHIPLTTREGATVRKGLQPIEALGGPTSYGSYGAGWANASNTPYRRFKHYIHEGGIRTPLIVSWPAGLARGLRAGITDQVGHVKDLLPTFLDLAGVPFPRSHGGAELTPLAGTSLASVLRGGKVDVPPLCWEHHGNRGVREGRWKLVAENKRGWELYDLESDPTERKDLAGERAEIVKRLSAVYSEWAARVGVVENPPKPKRKDGG